MITASEIEITAAIKAEIPKSGWKHEHDKNINRSPWSIHKSKYSVTGDKLP